MVNISGAAVNFTWGIGTLPAAGCAELAASPSPERVRDVPGPSTFPCAETQRFFSPRRALPYRRIHVLTVCCVRLNHVTGARDPGLLTHRRHGTQLRTDECAVARLGVVARTSHGLTLGSLDLARRLTT